MLFLDIKFSSTELKQKENFASLFIICAKLTFVASRFHSSSLKSELNLVTTMEFILAIFYGKNTVYPFFFAVTLFLGLAFCPRK